MGARQVLAVVVVGGGAGQSQGQAQAGSEETGREQYGYSRRCRESA